MSCKLALCLHAGEAIAAVNRAIGLRLERNTRFAAAGSAGSGVILSRATGGVLAGVTAGLAALRLILEATLCVEFLPNKETIAAMLEAERIAKDPSVKGYNDLDELFADLKK